MKKVVVSVVLTLLCIGISVAQHGTAEPGYYPPGFNGDTWTGEVTAVTEDCCTGTCTFVDGGCSLQESECSCARYQTSLNGWAGAKYNRTCTCFV